MENEYQLLRHDGGNEGIQIMNIQDAKLWYTQFVAFATEILKKDLDFGIIPGTDKPSLYKAGAEKLRFAFGLGVSITCIDKTTVYAGPDIFVDYTYQCTVSSKNGQQIAQCEGSCNSHEPNYRYMWITRDVNPSKEEADQLKDKKIGRWKIIKKAGKKDVFTFQDRINNDQILAKKNTIMKIAQKRAFVGAILLATGASEFFTQDLENLKGFDEDELPPDQEGENWEPEILDQWKTTIASCKTQEDLNGLLASNSKTIIASEILKGLMKSKEADIKKLSTKDKAKQATDDLADKLNKK